MSIINHYMIERRGNCCYKIYKRKYFMFIGYWSFMCDEVTFDGAKALIQNLKEFEND